MLAHNCEDFIGKPYQWFLELVAWCSAQLVRLSAICMGLEPASALWAHDYSRDNELTYYYFLLLLTDGLYYLSIYTNF